MALPTLPLEIFGTVLGNLGPDDYESLAMTSKNTLHYCLSRAEKQKCLKKSYGSLKMGDDEGVGMLNSSVRTLELDRVYYEESLSLSEGVASEIHSGSEEDDFEAQSLEAQANEGGSINDISNEDDLTLAQSDETSGNDEGDGEYSTRSDSSEGDELRDPKAVLSELEEYISSCGFDCLADGRQNIRYEGPEQMSEDLARAVAPLMFPALRHLSWKNMAHNDVLGLVIADAARLVGNPGAPFSCLRSIALCNKQLDDSDGFNIGDVARLLTLPSLEKIEASGIWEPGDDEDTIEYILRPHGISVNSSVTSSTWMDTCTDLT